MAQSDLGGLLSPLPGVTLRDRLKLWRDALHSMHAGNDRPDYVVPGMLWLDISGQPWILKVFQGAEDIVLGTLDLDLLKFIPSGVEIPGAGDIPYDGGTVAEALAGIIQAISDFGDLAGKDQISIDDIDTTGQPAGKYLTTAGDGSAIYTDPPVNANQLAKAWVNFNGTGTVAIRSSYNVSSITDNGTGNYTINFATPMSNANYAWGVSGLTNLSSSNAGVQGDIANLPTTSNITVKSYAGGNNQDFPYVSLIVFGG